MSWNLMLTGDTRDELSKKVERWCGKARFPKGVKEAIKSCLGKLPYDHGCVASLVTNGSNENGELFLSLSIAFRTRKL